MLWLALAISGFVKAAKVDSCGKLDDVCEEQFTEKTMVSGFGVNVVNRGGTIVIRKACGLDREIILYQQLPPGADVDVRIIVFYGFRVVVSSWSVLNEGVLTTKYKILSIRKNSFQEKSSLEGDWASHIDWGSRVSVRDVECSTRSYVMELSLPYWFVDENGNYDGVCGGRGQISRYFYISARGIVGKFEGSCGHTFNNAHKRAYDPWPTYWWFKTCCTEYPKAKWGAPHPNHANR